MALAMNYLASQEIAVIVASMFSAIINECTMVLPVPSISPEGGKSLSMASALVVIHILISLNRSFWTETQPAIADVMKSFHSSHSRIGS